MEITILIAVIYSVMILTLLAACAIVWVMIDSTEYDEETPKLDPDDQAYLDNQ